MINKLVFTVLGATGFIGNALAKHLSIKGHTVLTPDKNLKIDDLKENLKGHVVYCIGLTADFRSRPWETVDAHIGLLRQILPLGNFDSFTYLSSTRIYEGSESGKENTKIFVQPTDTDHIFNISKLMGESLCNWAYSQGKNVKIVRLSNVIGNDHSSENFFYSLLNEANTKGSFHLKSNLHSSKDYITLSDTIRMLELISSRGNFSCYNLASGFKIKHSYVANLISELTGSSFTAEKEAFNNSYPDIDITRIRNEFDFIPQSPFDALSDCILFRLNKNRS